MITKIKHLKPYKLEPAKRRKGYLWMIFLGAVLIYCSFFHKVVLLIILFEVAEYIKYFVRFRVQLFPVDFNFIFGIAASFYHSPVYGIIIYILAMFNRFIFGFFQGRYLGETVVHITFFFVSSLLRGLPFLLVSNGLLACKYLIKLIGAVITGDASILGKLHFYAINMAASLISFYLISKIAFLLV